MSQDRFRNLQPGTVINGRYEIVKCLGTGSMGMVYACRHRELAGHMVAMKVLFSEVARDSVAAARFRNEIVASYGVSHPNVVRAYEYFRDGDLIAFTMEYIGGGDLADRINGDKPLAIDEIIRMLYQMCQGVQAIHDAGIIHRDLKPENILITDQGDIKITDFGIARTGSGPKLTDHGGVIGTIDYLSAEYIERGQVDARSDIYALGVLAYEMITGAPPFRGQSVIETMTMRLRSDPEPPHKIRQDCPPELSAIVLKALARDPDQRYQTAADVAAALAALREKLRLPSNSRSGSYSAVEHRRGVGVEREKSTTMTLSSGMSAPVIEGAGINGNVTAVSAGDRQGIEMNRSPSRPSPLKHEGSGMMAVESATLKQAAREQLRSVIGANTPRFGSADRLDPVLVQRGRIDDDLFSSHDDKGGSTPSISMSVGRIPPERIRQLYADIGVPDNEGVLRNIVSVILVVFVGFFFSFFLLQWVKPELFDGFWGIPETYFRSEESSSSP